jgi:hypothetical protein
LRQLCLNFLFYKSTIIIRIFYQQNSLECSSECLVKGLNIIQSSRCTAHDNETAELASGGRGLSQDRLCTENSLQRTALLPSCMENSLQWTELFQSCTENSLHWTELLQSCTKKIPSVDCTSTVMHGKFRFIYPEEFPGTFPFHLSLHLIPKFHGTEFVIYI